MAKLGNPFQGGLLTNQIPGVNPTGSIDTGVVAPPSIGTPPALTGIDLFAAGLVGTGRLEDVILPDEPIAPEVPTTPFSLSVPSRGLGLDRDTGKGDTTSPAVEGGDFSFSFGDAAKGALLGLTLAGPAGAVVGGLFGGFTTEDESELGTTDFGNVGFGNFSGRGRGDTGFGGFSDTGPGTAGGFDAGVAGGGWDGF